MAAAAPMDVEPNRSIGLVVFDVGEALILVRRPLERTAFAGPPRDDLLDLPSELEILVGHAFGSMVHEAHLDPGVGRRDVGMMPRRLGKMTDRIDYHQRALPAVRLVLAPDPAVLVPPERQLLLQPRLDLVLGESALALLRVGHGCLRAFGHDFVFARASVYRNAMGTQTPDPPQVPCASVEVFAPARLHLGFLDISGTLGRHFGSLGLTIEGIG